MLDEYLEGVRSLELRRDRLDAAVAERAAEPDLAPVVSALRCLRGISTVTAFALAVEIGDFSRFPDARSFMSYVGLVPSESSSGEAVSRGRITRTGNGHARTLLVEAAWHHARRYAPMSPTAVADAAGVSAAVAEAASRANRRLHERCAHLRSRGKPANVVNAAVARELAGFVWALAVLAARTDASSARRACFDGAWGNPRRGLCAASGPRAILDTRSSPAEASECANQRADIRLAVVRRTRHANGLGRRGA